MLEIPLFPLNTVLFPGTPIHLHIFEPRYIKMVNHCVENSQPFGVALIRSGIEALGPLAEPHYIGCTAQIAQIQPLADGQMNLVAIGVERFRVLTIDRETKPYLVGRIQHYPIENPDPAGLDRRCVHLRRQFERFIKDSAGCRQPADGSFSASGRWGCSGFSRRSSAADHTRPKARAACQ